MISNLYREMSFVTRWGIFRRNHNQSVAEHSYFVALYAKRIADLIGWRGDISLLLECALIHDLFEGRSGDIPAPFKREMNMDEPYMEAEWQYFCQHFPQHLEALSALRGNTEVRAIIRVADRFEGCLFLATEWFSGNRNAGRHSQRTVTPARDMYLSLINAWGQLLDAIPGIDRNAIRDLEQAINEAETLSPMIQMASKEPYDFALAV